jgi:hypothetical protein
MRLRALVLEKLSAAGHKLPPAAVTAEVVPRNAPRPAAAVAAAANNPVKERPTSYLPAGDALVQSRNAAAAAAAEEERGGHFFFIRWKQPTDQFTKTRFGHEA